MAWITCVSEHFTTPYGCCLVTILGWLIDDLDGSEATETVRFALDGSEYEVDLAGQNADELRGVLARFVHASRKAVESSTKPTPAVPSLSPAADTKAVRAWAARQLGLLLDGRKLSG